VEDRETSRLFLELGTGSGADGAERAAALVGEPAVLRASWWSNCLPGRTELPMRITDGDLLVVAELTEDGEAPGPRPDSTAFTFRRHRRPSQGILTGCATTGLLVVWITPRTPDMAANLRDWGDFVHIRHIAAAGIPGFTQISVFENESAPDPLYMHLYEFDSEDAEATYQTMVEYVAPRLGGIESEPFADWADWRSPGGRLWYCNTFNLAGQAPRSP
jgi:hypothetical protein